MAIISENLPLSDNQDELLELRKVIAKLLLDKARDNADAIWDEKGYTDEQIDQLTAKK
jgi:hypothetical protein